MLAFASRIQFYKWVMVVCGGGGGRCYNLKNGRKPVKLQKKSPAGCAGEVEQNKGN